MIKHIHWALVKKIISMFDAVVGLDANDNVLIDDFCPCSEADILKKIELIFIES